MGSFSNTDLDPDEQHRIPNIRRMPKNKQVRS